MKWSKKNTGGGEGGVGRIGGRRGKGRGVEEGELRRAGGTGRGGAGEARRVA